MGQRIIIMAGGTGGHVFPALAVAQYLVAQGWDVSWLGTKRGMESHVVPDNNLEIDWLAVEGLRGKGWGAKVKSGVLLIQSFFQAFSVFAKRKPDVVLGFGGYVAGPGGLIAKLMGIALVIHEQNRVPGTTNRLLMNKANKVLQAFPESFSADINALFTGNPLRTEFSGFPEKQLWNAALDRDFRILVVGGSQGAKILNDIVPIAAEKLDKLAIKHQTGVASFKAVAEKYKKITANAQAVAFIDDMAAAYQWADMIICRSGAMTVSEVAAAGLPAIFIPLPHAIDDHQTANAHYLVDAGAGILLPQSELNVESLLGAIKEIQGSLKAMCLAAKTKAKLDATAVVAEHCIQESKK